MREEMKEVRDEDKVLFFTSASQNDILLQVQFEDTRLTWLSVNAEEYYGYRHNSCLRLMA